MESNKLYWWKAIASFLFVLLLMPLGHAFMILMEHTLNEAALHYCAFALGACGVCFAIIGVFCKGDTCRTLWGLIGGMLFWTGWVEFLFQYYATRYGAQPDIDPVTGEIITRPEYLILPASFGFWAIIMLLYLFCTRTGCNFITWWQKLFFGKRLETIIPRSKTRHSSLVTFMELTMIMWSSYLLLMFCYDNRFLGDSHPITLVIGAACLVGLFFIFRKQLHISSWGANIRMAIATVIIFWTPVEIMGRNNLLTEIWIAPFSHITEMLVILATFLVLGIYLAVKSAQSSRGACRLKS